MGYEAIAKRKNALQVGNKEATYTWTIWSEVINMWRTAGGDRNEAADTTLGTVNYTSKEREHTIMKWVQMFIEPTTTVTEDPLITRVARSFSPPKQSKAPELST